MQISANKVVTLKYKLSNHSTGEQIEETNETNPLVFLYGVGSLIPEFEDNLADKTVGDAFDFHIAAANASSAFAFSIGRLLPSTAFPVFTLIYPPA